MSKKEFLEGVGGLALLIIVIRLNSGFPTSLQELSDLIGFSIIAALCLTALGFASIVVVGSAVMLYEKLTGK